MAKTDQHDFNYRLKKDGNVSNTPQEAYGSTKMRASHTFGGPKIEKVDH